MRMGFLAGLVGLLLVLTAEARVGNSSESSVCTETKECLLYNLVCKNQNYEARHYEAVKWVSTDEESYMAEKAVIIAFKRLFRYINGSNEAGVKIDMTAPVIVTMMDHVWPWQSSGYTLSFLLPSAHQSNPPIPTDDEVYFTDMPDMMVYVRSFGGWWMSWVSKMQARFLGRHLKMAGASYNREFHYAAGYDSPMKFWDRHNEVGYIIEGEPVC